MYNDKKRAGRPCINIMGQRFGKLTAVRFLRIEKHRTIWEFRCECGNAHIATYHDVRKNSLGNSRVTSCGCTRFKGATTHGMSRTPEYQAWVSIKDKCYNPNNKRYKNYGQRGIQVCARWRESFVAFYEDMGDRPNDKLSIERIDVNGDYEPNNCRWASKYDQANNTTKTAWLVIDGIRKSTTQWSRELGISPYLLKKRYEQWST